MTAEGFIFVVIGNVHPNDRVIAYLKYVPDPQGEWSRNGKRYRRALKHYSIPSVIDSMQYLRANASQYLFESPVHGMALPAVPVSRIAEHLCPEQRLAGLEASGGRDELEKKAIHLVELLSRGAGVGKEWLGVTGSLLAGMHDPSFSDIDLIVYGFSNAVRVRSFLQNQKNSERLLLRSLFGEAKEKWIAERLLSSCLTRENATDLLSRKWNIGLFGETVFSIHSVKTEDEVRERYGEERYTPLGVVDATTRVRNSNDSIFMPAIYEVEPKTLGTRPSYVIDRVVSFEGLYSDVVRQGEEMLCRGKLERVESSRGV